MNLQIINDSGKEIKYATDGAGGIDLPWYYVGDIINNVRTVHTGVSVAIPEGYVGLLVERSSMHKSGWGMVNNVGVIDSDYRGEILIKVDPRDGNRVYPVGEYVAQLVIVPCPKFTIIEVDELPTSARGEGGFGSTDRKLVEL